MLSYAVPLTGHVMADTLSESTFLLFWTWGLWTALRFLREGRFVWLPPTIGFAALAYWAGRKGCSCRPRWWRPWRDAPLLLDPDVLAAWWAAVAFLVIGPGLLIGPYIATKGGLGTKPGHRSPAGHRAEVGPLAVEAAAAARPEPVDGQDVRLAARAMAMAVRDAVTLPLLPLAVAGLLRVAGRGERSRAWVFLVVMIVAWALALIRLHATGGYCTPGTR